MSAKEKPTEIPYSDNPKDLVRWREYVGVTQEELAKEAGVSRSLVAVIECGAKPFSANAKVNLWSAIQRLNGKRAAEAAEIAIANANLIADIQKTMQFAGFCPDPNDQLLKLQQARIEELER